MNNDTGDHKSTFGICDKCRHSLISKEHIPCTIFNCNQGKQMIQLTDDEARLMIEMISSLTIGKEFKYPGLHAELNDVQKSLIKQLFGDVGK